MVNFPSKTRLGLAMFDSAKRAICYRIYDWGDAVFAVFYCFLCENRKYLFWRPMHETLGIVLRPVLKKWKVTIPVYVILSRFH